jgi:hypothetical protein
VVGDHRNSKMVNWDTIISITIILALILFIWSKISKQTVKETILDIKDLLSGGGEEVEEKVGEIIEYN